jgi:hypothetical protein
MPKQQGTKSLSIRSIRAPEVLVLVFTEGSLIVSTSGSVTAGTSHQTLLSLQKDDTSHMMHIDEIPEILQEFHV